MFGNAVIYRLTSGSVFYPLPAQIKKNTTNSLYQLQIYVWNRTDRIKVSYGLICGLNSSMDFSNYRVTATKKKQQTNIKGYYCCMKYEFIMHVSILCQREQKNQYNHNKIPNMKLYKHLKPLLCIIYFHLF